MSTVIELDKTKALRALVDTFYAVQKERIGASNRLQAIFMGVDENDPLRQKVMGKIAQLQKLEEAILRDALSLLRDIPVWDEFLSKVKGIGPALGAKLLSLPLDPRRNLSAWWAYFGLVPYAFKCECARGHRFINPKVPPACPVETGYGEERQKCGAKIVKTELIDRAPRRTRGAKGFWNPKARSLAYLIGRQFALVGENGYYGRLYKQAKEIYKRKHPDFQPIRIDAQARRYAVKIFLAHYYQTVCELNGIPYRLPYAIEILGHDSFIHWLEVLAQGG